ncbi:DUF4169 family protein [Sulfitobacter sp. F26169L]|uniref:DUF4169 family protein n=1 Tax=Sulfitobacter sp. F26169L TaxID=2996015 RepID=UPI002260DE71|nr:DUF4169 family protein [Sulfitobacter sp. F26169L]MCX7565531.1 DUF4169 family protein [Sulfitobacter sp. F26169L]
MSAPINLNKARKDRDRSARKSHADENAVKFGQTKAQKEALKARAQLIARNLDGHKRDT